MSIPKGGATPVCHARGRVITTLTALLVAIIVAVTTACDPGHGVTYENRTDHQVTIFHDDVRAFVLEASETKTYSLFKFSGSTLFEARDAAGSVLYSESLTWDELKRRGWKIVIREAGPTSGSPTVVPTEPDFPSPN